VAAADEALKWDGLYRQEDAEDFVDGKHVDTEERGLLKKIRKPKNETMRRETYRTVVLNLCMMVSLVEEPNNIQLSFLSTYGNYENLSFRISSPYIFLNTFPARKNLPRYERRKVPYGSVIYPKRNFRCMS